MLTRSFGATSRALKTSVVAALALTLLGGAALAGEANLAGTRLAAASDDSGGFTPLEQPQGDNSFTPVGEATTRDDNSGTQRHGEPPAPDTASSSTTPAAQFSVTVPTVHAVDSNVDEATLRDVLSGKLADHADEVAGLTATSITIPEIDISFKVATETTTVSSDIVVRDVDLENVSDGIAQSVSIGSEESHGSDGSVAHFSKISVEHFDLGLTLGIYGLVKRDPSEPLKTLYDNFVADGGTLTTPKANCSYGRMSLASAKARPLKMSFSDLTAMFTEMAAAKGQLQKDKIAKIIDFYREILSAFETSPMKIGGFDCNATDNDAKPVKISIGGMTIGNLGGVRFPDFTMRDLAVDVGDKGSISLGAFQLKSFDLSSVFDAAEALLAKGDSSAPTADEARTLVPPFPGFSVQDFKMDVPDDQSPGERVKASLADFDLDLGNYVNGIPTMIASHSDHLNVTLPPTSSDSTVQALLSAGVKNVDVSYDLAARWDAASKEIRLTRFAVDGVHLGSLEASSVLGQATDDLFASDVNAAMAAWLGLTVKRVDVHLRDDGLGDLIAEAAMHGSGKGAAEIRRTGAAMVQAALLFFLGGAANADEVASAVGKFTNGAPSLSVSAIANDLAGISIATLQGLADNPGDVGSQITIDAAAR